MRICFGFNSLKYSELKSQHWSRDSSSGEVKSMIEGSCPRCPQCGTQMQQDSNGVCKCPECHATFIPGKVSGVFIPLSMIGIH